MDQEEQHARVHEIQGELEKLMQEFLNITDVEDGTSGLMTACVIAFEGTRYDNEGRQVYRTDYLMLEPTSHTASIGLVQDTLWRIQHDKYGHCSGEEL